VSTEPYRLYPIERDERSAPFFEALAEGVVMLQYSPSSGRWSSPGARRCEFTYANDLEWRPSTGHARLVSWTIIPDRATPIGAETIIGIVELSEGPWLVLQVHPGTRALLRSDAEVTVSFARPAGSEAIPVASLLSRGSKPEAGR
jgi:uncharacterized OB-fold protein